MRTLWLLLVAISLAGCTSMLLGNTSSREAPSGTSSGAAPSAADSAITRDLAQRLGADAELSRYSIGVRSRAGRVTLSGTVGGYNLRSRAVDLARETPGVSSVDNRIIVNTNL